METLKEEPRSRVPHCSKLLAPQRSKVLAPQRSKVLAPQSSKVLAPQSSKVLAPQSREVARAMERACVPVGTFMCFGFQSLVTKWPSASGSADARSCVLVGTFRASLLCTCGERLLLHCRMKVTMPAQGRRAKPCPVPSIGMSSTTCTIVETWRVRSPV
eukprot:6177756-Pleurochrysis_carterae.AAC.2